MYVVTVDFLIHPAHREAFEQAMLENARASKRDEPGCRQFDVCRDPARPDAIFLYELYDDRAAFDAHRSTPHFKRFDAKVADWVAHKAVRTYERIEPR